MICLRVSKSVIQTILVHLLAFVQPEFTSSKEGHFHVINRVFHVWDQYCRALQSKLIHEDFSKSEQLRGFSSIWSTKHICVREILGIGRYYRQTSILSQMCWTCVEIEDPLIWTFSSIAHQQLSKQSRVKLKSVGSDVNVTGHSFLLGKITEEPYIRRLHIISKQKWFEPHF